MRARSIITALAALALVVAGVPAVANADASARRGAIWLANQRITTTGQQADRVVAFAAAGVPRITLIRDVRAMRSGAPAYAQSAGGAAKVILATRAARMNPRSLGGVDYVARLKARYAGGRFGASTYDQAYGILALRSAGERVPAAAIAALRRTRGAGGWGYDLDPHVRDDVSATALVIEATRAAGVSARDPMLAQATAWMLRQRNARGGYAINGAGGATEADSTALALRALRAMGRRAPAGTVRELKALQEPDGGFRYTRTIRESRVMATNDAVLALAGRRLPPPY